MCVLCDFCYFRLACSISMSNVCVGAPPLQCFKYRLSSPLVAMWWISGSTDNNLVNLSCKNEREIGTLNSGWSLYAIYIFVYDITSNLVYLYLRVGCDAIVQESLQNLLVTFVNVFTIANPFDVCNRKQKQTPNR